MTCNLLLRAPADEPDDTPAHQTGTPDPTVPSNRVEPTDWRLTLVNRWHPLPEDWTPQLVPLEGGWEIDSRCYDDLTAMLDDCRQAGASPLICSAYRSQDAQGRLYEQEVSVFLAQGYSRGEAEAAAAEQVALPGTSEHQLGLAVDLVDAGYQLLDEAQEQTATQMWLMENSWRYGFILRYPPDKTAVTGIIYEPWHYRYVGRDYAEDLYERGVCLEEYLSGR